jgi:lysophospholipase L1-like esterase
LGFLSRHKSLVFAIVANLTVLLSLEAIVRLAESVRADQAKTRIVNDSLAGLVFSPELGWERTPGFKGPVFDGILREFDAQGYFSIDSKRVGDRAKKKVLFFGDSSTYGIGIKPSDTFVEVVNELMPDVDAINLGVPGYTSFQGMKALEKYLPLLKPAAVVVSFNHNDRRAVYYGDEPDSTKHFQKVYRKSMNPMHRANHILGAIHLSGVLAGVMRRAHLLPRPPQQFRIDRLRPRVDEASYRKNLSEMADQCERQGIPLIFLVLRDNPLRTGYIDKGVESLEAGNYKAAIEYLTPVAGSDLWYSDLARINLRRAYEAQGDRASAEQNIYSLYPNPSLHGGPPQRLDSAYNEIMRQVAREKNVQVVEGAASLAADPYVYVDNVHFSPIGHRIVGKLVASRLATVLEQPAPRDVEVAIRLK